MEGRSTRATGPAEAQSTSVGRSPMLRSFRSSNYRLYFAGQTFSLIGTWMQGVAMSWLVYRLTGSALLLGVIGFVSQIPALFASPLAGVLADRWDKRRLLIATQVLAMVQAFILAFLALAGIIQTWEIILLSLFLGIVNSFDVPVRQSFVVEMVEEREDLPNAIALNSSMFHGTRLIGPSLAGLIIAAMGEGVCFLINGFSYLAVICSLLAMRTAPLQAAARNRDVLRELQDGFSYAFGFTPIRSILLLLAGMSLIGFPSVVLMPVFAKEVLQGGPHTFGFLMTAIGGGAFISALYLASRRNVLGLGRIIAIAPAVFGGSIIAFSFSSSITISLAMLVFAGFGMMIQVASSNTILQTIVDDDKRGRVMSLYTTAFLGVSPFGSLLVGWLAGRVGAPLAVALAGVCCLVASAAFACSLPSIRKAVRPVYERLGILPSRDAEDPGEIRRQTGEQ